MNVKFMTNRQRIGVLLSKVREVIRVWKLLLDCLWNSMYRF